MVAVSNVDQLRRHSQGAAFAPDAAFEHDADNVANAISQFGLRYTRYHEWQRRVVWEGKFVTVSE